LPSIEVGARLKRPQLERAKCPHARTYRRLHRAPWLLATSLPHARGSSRKIKQLYAQRMQIEETFRDTKSHRSGLGLHYARCDNGRRLEVLLLIAALASLVLWLVGLCGRALDWSRRVQANTDRRRPVLSTVFIGRQLLRRSALDLPRQVLDLAISELRALIMAAVPT